MEESGQQPPESKHTRSPRSTKPMTSVDVTALDGVVHVNSLFTIAVFLGMSLTSPGQHSLEKRPGCDPGDSLSEQLMVFEVLSFSFFLFSSLIAQGLKMAINILNSKDADEAFKAYINPTVLRAGMLFSAIGSVFGCLFLMLSMTHIIQIRLGFLSCGSTAAVISETALIFLVSTAILGYISTAFYAFMH